MSSRAYPGAKLDVDCIWQRWKIITQSGERGPAMHARQTDCASCMCRGPGAGAEVTAGGVFSDLLRLAAYLGAPS